MTVWLPVGLLGGLVGLDATSFPQAMISRPLIAGALTGTVFGRPIEGAVIGFMLELFALITLPIGAALYPESGTACVAATGAYLAAVPVGLEPGYLVLTLAFALAWERATALTVVLQRRMNGRMLIRVGAMAAEKLERRHLAAMTSDFVRGAVISLAGGLMGLALLRLLGPHWGLPAEITARLLMVVGAAMVGTAIPLFGGLRARRLAVAAGVATGVLAAVVLP
jgi:mannose/fructose/N-acetylgalactosamine-specific phosphotransferase system component IIC